MARCCASNEPTSSLNSVSTEGGSGWPSAASLTLISRDNRSCAAADRSAPSPMLLVRFVFTFKAGTNLFGVHASACPRSPSTLKGGHQTSGSWRVKRSVTEASKRPPDAEKSRPNPAGWLGARRSRAKEISRGLSDQRKRYPRSEWVDDRTLEGCQNFCDPSRVVSYYGRSGGIVTAPQPPATIWQPSGLLCPTRWRSG